MNKCIYCGNEAKYQFKNGKWCCCKNQSSCPKIRKIQSKNSSGKNNPRYGVKLSEETKDKISKSNKGRISSKITRKKISEANKGKKKPEGFGEKIAEINRTRYFSKETRQKISESNKGKKVSQKNRQLTSQRMSRNQYALGNIHSEETKMKMRGPRPHTTMEKSWNWTGGALIWWRNDLKKMYNDCSLCHSDVNLEMHHKDSNRDNNERSNLIILCRDCHRWWHYN
jgi:hypothetical protein